MTENEKTLVDIWSRIYALAAINAMQSGAQSMPPEQKATPGLIKALFAEAVVRLIEGLEQTDDVKGLRTEILAKLEGSRVQ